jgi:hypothetical protein
VIVLHAHVHYSFSKVEVVVHFVKAVVDADLVLRVEDGFDVSPRESSVDDVSEDDGSISTGPSNNCSIVTPGKTED